ncbi:hypothetical protein [Bradyrhizobium jicamae]|uniref:hypothetical protein n=1 Tax=Bradyrhizobium jicamae TaxID=280332 RepID=UPI001BAB1330|nr:hypothetical protein [Bradyrhizobium jicamae]MBR0939524.1 hypothetical protein [Bradyrhizobium jicamae]
MAHLVPNPPPVDYQKPQITSFSIGADGVGKLLAWGCAPGKNWRVGTDFADEVVSDWYTSTFPDLTYFYIKGARKGMKLAIFVVGDSGSWVRYSEYVEVDSNLGDKWAAKAAAGILNQSSYNSHIKFYPFGAPQGNPSMSEDEWMNKIEETLGTLNRNVIGSCVLRNIRKDIVIHPFLRPYQQAYSSVLINPGQWVTDFRPGARVDEVLLHELIHVIENNARVYENRYGFTFDSSDFLTVNATNVYSCMLGRGLRKDHGPFEYLPVEHFRNPKLHWEQQSPNYWAASGTAPDLVRVLGEVEGFWNPFSYLAQSQKIWGTLAGD